MKRDVAVSIVTHKTATSELKEAVDCIIRCPRVYSIDILDNSGTALPEEYSKALAGLPDAINIIRIPNHGYGAGHNISIRKSLAEESIEYHLVMNSDIRWAGDVISKLTEVLDERRDIAQIMPKVFYPDGDLQLTTRRLPTPWDVFAKRFLPGFITRKRIDRYLLKEANHDLEINSPYLLGSFMLLRTKALRRTGLFDERFFMYPEDIDMTRRLHRHFSTLYYPGVSIIHDHKAASRTSRKMLWIHVTNMIRYFNKWGWWHDPERRAMNRKLDASIEKLNPEDLPPSRG